MLREQFMNIFSLFQPVSTACEEAVQARYIREQLGHVVELTLVSDLIAHAESHFSPPA